MAYKKRLLVEERGDGFSSSFRIVFLLGGRRRRGEGHKQGKCGQTSHESSGGKNRLVRSKCIRCGQAGRRLAVSRSPHRLSGRTSIRIGRRTPPTRVLCPANAQRASLCFPLACTQTPYPLPGRQAPARP